MAKQAPPKPSNSAAVEAASKTPETEAVAAQAKADAKAFKSRCKVLTSLSKGSLVKLLAAKVSNEEAKALQGEALGI